MFKLIVILENIFNVDPRMSDWMEYKGYRKARGGYWGNWDTGTGLHMWYPTCKHFSLPYPGIILLEKESYE